MIPVTEALDIVLGAVRPLPPERVPILEARGRVLAEDIVAPRDLPPRDNSAMDGYALRREDLARGTTRFRVLEAIAAGGESSHALQIGEAAKIMTGAPIPEGADTVVPVEDTRADGDWVEVAEDPGSGANIRPAGEDVRRGELVIPSGSVVRPAEVGMLASLGRSQVLVRQRPRVAVLATGDEIVEPDAPVDGDRIINSNSYGLAAQVAEAGGVPIILGIGRDDPQGLSEMLERSATADMVLTTGGVSMGDYDYVRPVLAELGVAIRFWQVAIKPGKPVVFGMRGRVPVFGLPGNPVSAMVVFEELVRPVLRCLLGHRNLFRPVFEATLAEDAGPVRTKTGRMDFIRCRVERRGQELVVVSVKKQGSGMLKTMVQANGLLLIRPESSGARPGDTVAVQIYDPEFFEGRDSGLPLAP